MPADEADFRAPDGKAAMESVRQAAHVDLQLRIGINSGPVVAGIIGFKKFTYDLWGDTINVASRMETAGVAGRIQVSERVYTALKDKYRFEERGRIEIRGKGEMLVYFLEPPGPTTAAA
jgi:adenylate cyclase